MEVATVNRPDHAVVFHQRDNPRMDTVAPNQTGAFVFHPPRSRRRHGHHNHHHRGPYYHNYPSDSDTESTLSTRSSCSSTTDSDGDDDSVYYHGHRVSFRPRHHRATRRRHWWWGGWPRRGVLACPEPSYYTSPPWTAVTSSGLGVLGAAGLVPAAAASAAGFVTTTAGTVVPQLHLQQAQPQQQQQQQQQPRRYGYRRFHYQGGERHQTAIPSWATGSQTSPWRYGGPNGNQNSGPGDTVGPGGTIEEVEEGGTAPAQPPTTVQPTAVLPVPVATPAAIDPYDHYHLSDEERGGRGRRRRSRHSRRRRHRDDVDNGMLGLVERERRRDSERQMADADASHRREAMMMELMERARRGDRDRDRAGGSPGRLDARDILGVLLDGVVAERKGRRGGGGRRGDDVEEEEGGGGKDGREDGLRGALDALSRRVDEMVLSGREEAAVAATSGGRKMKTDVAPRVKFNKVDSDSGSGVNRNDGGGAGGGKVIFSRRGEDGDQADTDTDETSRPSLVGGGRGVRRGRTLKRAGSASTSAD
ncbi:hypothetical protein KVR01_009443 [Diaporthe batatas]|uniref:uncharacterized protein n=1 Tax=Diaporthe batatas TaxID=748121 RepID=UPI001D046AB6|nr:uncharacterized protein KVR01_009443 [Diaporthe batatas]KAG8161179.1 hypothetical protein KVR01_009443 [Diaporthe batatas]